MRLYYKLLLLFVLIIILFTLIYSIYTENSNSDHISLHRLKQFRFSYNKNEVYNVWCIFTKVRSNSSIKIKFQTMLLSLLNNTSSVITLNLIVDSSSRFVAKDVIFKLQNITKKEIKMIFYDVNAIAVKIEDVVDVMRKHFSSQPGAYYSDSLFFISLVLYKIATDQSKVVMIDVDTFIKTDIVELFNEFDNFSDTNLFGAGPELSPVYNHILYRYRQSHNSTRLGTAPSDGGFPGVNSGVLALHLSQMRKSKLYDQLLKSEKIEELAKKYSFKGHLGDQDFFTLISLEYRELLYLLDCGWNRQLCTWWSEHGYAETFHKFFSCNSPIKIYHGNCNTPLPTN